MTGRRSLAGVLSLRWWSLLLVPGGFVAGHELGYAAASLLGAPPVAGGHGYLTVVVLVGVPFAFAAAIRAFLAGLRYELPPVGWPALASGQVALFVAPVLVITSFFVGPGPMPLVFNGFEIAAVVIGVLVAYQVTNEGESNWFEGVQLLALYAILALTFFYA